MQKQCDQLHVPCAVLALPKSIDNDFLLLDKTFGWALCGPWVGPAWRGALAAGAPCWFRHCASGAVIALPCSQAGLVGPHLPSSPR